MRVKQDDRMNLDKTLAIMEITKSYLEKINSVWLKITCDSILLYSYLFQLPKLLPFCLLVDFHQKYFQSHELISNLSGIISLKMSLPSEWSKLWATSYPACSKSCNSCRKSFGSYLYCTPFDESSRPPRTLKSSSFWNPCTRLQRFPWYLPKYSNKEY